MLSRSNAHSHTVYMCMEVKVTLYVRYVYVFILGILVLVGCLLIQRHDYADVYVQHQHTRAIHTQLAVVVVAAALECVLSAVYCTAYNIGMFANEFFNHMVFVLIAFSAFLVPFLLLN